LDNKNLIYYYLKLIQILTEKGYWNNLTKINSIDKTISLEDAINEVKKMVKEWGGKIFDPITKQFLKVCFVYVCWEFTESLILFYTG